MKTKCPHCGQHYDVDDVGKNQTFRCQHCRRIFTPNDNPIKQDSYMKTECPHCGQHYELDEEYNNQSVICDKCSKEFIASWIKGGEAFKCMPKSMSPLSSNQQKSVNNEEDSPNPLYNCLTILKWIIIVLSIISCVMIVATQIEIALVAIPFAVCAFVLVLSINITQFFIKKKDLEMQYLETIKNEIKLSNELTMSERRKKLE